MKALVIEGGGMRAAYANGVLAAFEDAGYGGFDAVYGTSAGGALAAWWSARQARYALATWPYAQDRRILSYRRWLARRGPLLDHDALFALVYEREHPLDVKAVERAHHAVVVTVTDADTGETGYPDIRRGPVLAWLRATGRLPLATGPAVVIDDHRWLDGGISAPIPLARAIADGHRDIALILNRPRGSREPEHTWTARMVGRRYPACADLARRHHELWNEAARLAEDPPAGVRVSAVRPARDHGVGRLTRDIEKIRAAIRMGEQDGRAFLDRR